MWVISKERIDSSTSTIKEILKRIIRNVEGINRESYTQWVNKALENGAGIAHRFTSQTPKAPPLPEKLKDEETGKTVTGPNEKGTYSQNHGVNYGLNEGMSMNCYAKPSRC